MIGVGGEGDQQPFERHGRVGIGRRRGWDFCQLGVCRLAPVTQKNQVIAAFGTNGAGDLPRLQVGKQMIEFLW